MAGQHQGLRAQRPQLPINSLQKLVHGAPRKVRSSNAAGKEHVPAKQTAGRGPMVAKTVRAVAGNRQRLDALAQQFHAQTAAEHLADLEWRNSKGRPRSLSVKGLQRQPDIVGTEGPDLAAMLRSHFSCIPNVVKMLMSQQQDIHLAPLTAQPGGHALRSVHQHPTPPHGQQVSVGMRRASGENFKISHTHWQLESVGHFKAQPSKSSVRAPFEVPPHPPAMLRRTFLTALTLVLTLLLPVEQVGAQTNFGQVAMYVARMLQSQHYSHRDVDDELSAKLLENYLNLLDFRHVFFTQEDVDRLRGLYGTTLDDAILMRNISPAIEIYDIYKQRVEQRIEFVRNTLAKEQFTFDSKRSIELKRDKAPYPKNLQEQDQLWRNLIEENLLQEKLSDISKKEEAKRKEQRKASQATKAGSPAPAAKAKDAKGSGSTKAEEQTPQQRVLRDYERLLESINENDQEDIVDFFLSSLSVAYDPHTEYMSQAETDSFNISMKHKLVGIGALLGLEDDVAQIQGIVVGGPADKQGELRLNDKILAVAQGEADFVDTKFMKLNKIVEMIRGDEGSTVRLRIAPSSDPDNIKIVSIIRAQVELKEKLANAELLITPPSQGPQLKLGWINLSSFYADMEAGTVSTTEDVQRLLVRLMSEKIDGLVLDLRGNGGGSLEEAIRLTGLFVPAGPVVQAKDWQGRISMRECETPKALYEGPMIVLTDKTSASASEILAAALQDYRRALIVGDKSTFGKGTVQTILPVGRYMRNPTLRDEDRERAGNLKVTIQKFYRIAGGSTQLKGVEPDLVLPSIRDVLDIGEASADNPLPYDTIPAVAYGLVKPEPWPLAELSRRLNSRMASNPEFGYIREESKRLQDRIKRNRVSLNLSERQKENDDSKQRRDQQEKERETRVKEAAKQEGFKAYRLTLDNVDKPELMPEADFTREKSTGMRMAKNQDDDEDSAETKFPLGLEPVKMEAVHVMRDLLELTGKLPAAAKTADDKEPAKSAKTAP